MGTTITKGRGKAVVSGTGMTTQMGQIAGMLDTIETERTPLQEKLGSLGKYIGIGCLLICAVVTVTGIIRGEPVFDMLLTGISLAVAAIPELSLIHIWLYNFYRNRKKFSWEKRKF